MKDTSEEMRRNMQNIDVSNQYNCDNTSIMDSGKLLGVNNNNNNAVINNRKGL